MSHLMMQMPPMHNNYPSLHQSMSQSMSQPSPAYMYNQQQYNPLMMSSIQQPIHQSINTSMNPPINQQPMNQQPINQSMNHSMNSSMNHPMMMMQQQGYNQPINQSMSQPIQATIHHQSLMPTTHQSINPSMNPTSNQSNVPSSNEVRVSFSSMLVHPHHANVIYYQLRADGHNQDLIIEHPTGWSIVNPEATFIEHLVSQVTNARISRDKWPIPQPMQLTFKSCDTSRLMPERTVTRFTVSRFSQMEWKESMKAVKSLKDEEVVRAKMKVSFGLYRAQLSTNQPAPPIVAYESVILLGWRTTRSSAKRRVKTSTSQASTNQSANQSSTVGSEVVNSDFSTSSTGSHGQDSLLGSVPDLVLDPVDSAVSTPSSNGSMSLLGLMNMTDRSSTKRGREVHQSINEASANIDRLMNSSEPYAPHVSKRVKLFGSSSSVETVKRPSPSRPNVNESYEPQAPKVEPHYEPIMNSSINE